MVEITSGGNSTATCAYSTATTTTQIIVYSYSIATILLNVLVLIVAYQYVNLKRRLEQWFVVNMTLADFIFSLVFTTTLQVVLHIPWFLCRLYFVLIWTTSIGSCISLLFLNIYKLITLFFPFRTLVFITRRRILILITSSWVVILISSIVFSLKPIFVLLPSECYQCQVYIDPIYYLIRLIILYISPLILSLIISACIVVLAQKHSRRTNKLFQRIVFVFSSTVWSSMTFLPHRIISSKVQLCKYHEQQQSQYVPSLADSYGYEALNETWPDYLNGTSDAVYGLSGYASTSAKRTSCHDPTFAAFTYLFAFGMVVNPLITIFTQTKYRRGVVDMLCRMCYGRGKPRITERKHSEFTSFSMHSSNVNAKYSTVTM